MAKDFDVIVIGAGNGGLFAGAFAAKNKLKTLVVEKHNLPGGSATSFVRGRFDFEAALHELCNLGTPENPGGIMKLFMAIQPDIEWATDMEESFRLVIPDEGIDALMPCGVREFIGKMEYYCPGSAPIMSKVVEAGMMCVQAYAFMDDPEYTPEVFAEKFPDFYKYAGHSINEVLDEFGLPEKAKTILSTYWCYLGANADELDFAIYIRMVLGYLAYGAGMPKLRSHEISMALEKVIRDCGGEVWYNTEISKVLVKDGKACGVMIGDKAYEAEYIVSNAYPDAVYGKMIDKEDVPEYAGKLINSRKRGLTFVTVYLGMNKSMEELGIKNYTTFISPSSDTKKLQEAATDTYEYSGYVIFNCLNKPIPDCTPEGTCQLFLTTAYFGNGWDKVTEDMYFDLKNETARKMIEDCERVLGLDLKPYIEEIVIATPMTFARYLGTPGGTPYGYQVTPVDTFIQRGLTEKDESYLKNLFFVGAASKRGDGYSSAYLSGFDAGKAILRAEREKGGLER
ncbi:MAG: NAD(P)/FAD-dependent oxidoreductase [Eubacterium sp.]|nr:NAD(P)/FAD-dependent oxidoreductase [Eubacterium sp.]